MNDFKIIEDCSPYYIRYKHTTSNEVISLCLDQKKSIVDPMHEKRKFMHCRLDESVGIKILEKVYCEKELNLMRQRVSLFVTQPGHYYRPHRDGMDTPMGINYHINILDDKCITSWYNNTVFDSRPIDTKGNVSREIADYDRSLEKDIIKPVKSMIAVQGEAVLFNTDLYHDVDNTVSNNERTILTLRSTKLGELDFFKARKILFGY